MYKWKEISYFKEMTNGQEEEEEERQRNKNYNVKSQG